MQHPLLLSFRLILLALSSSFLLRLCRILGILKWALGLCRAVVSCVVLPCMVLYHTTSCHTTSRHVEQACIPFRMGIELRNGH